MSLRVAIIGCGAIGRDIAHEIDKRRIPNASLNALFDIIPYRASDISSGLRSHPQSFSDFSIFLSSKAIEESDIIIECASQDAARQFAGRILEKGKSIMIMSVGALADLQFFNSLIQLANEKGAHVYIPTGAIAGIDAIRSVSKLLDKVVLTTTKHPRALAGAPFFEKNNVKLDSIEGTKILFEGPANEAVKLFPANVNVAAVLSIAGMGIEKTIVRIIADTTFTVNQHEITASGSFGEIRILVQNKPSPANPKTSYLAVLSAIECLRSICNDTVRIGT